MLAHYYTPRSFFGVDRAGTRECVPHRRCDVWRSACTQRCWERLVLYYTPRFLFFLGAYRAGARECVLTRTANIDIAACNVTHTATHTATHAATQFYNSDELASRSLTALHCNTLQHTASHCNTLQHSFTIRMSSPCAP